MGTMVVGLAVLLAVPAGVVLTFRLGRGHQPLPEEARDADPVVAQLLQGEHLVPPPPLPPDVFLTAEVEALRPDVRTADRKWDRLDADFRQRLLLAYRLMRERHGYDMVLLEGYRSPGRQAQLQAMGAHVTRAGPFQSYHQFGLAADSAFLRQGRLVLSEKEAWAERGYALFGEVAESVGLRWGGRWAMRDLGHVELARAGGVRPAD